MKKLLLLLLLAAPAQAQEVSVLIKYRSGGLSAIQAVGTITRQFTLVNAVAARVPREAIGALRSNPAVELVEIDGTATINDQELDDSWGVKKIGAGFVHDSGNFGEGIKVAVVDTGVDYNHPELAAAFRGGIDCINNDNDPLDDHFHGTHVAGTILAADDGVGVVGVAPKALLYGIKVLGANGSGSYSHIICGLDWAVANGIQVTNNSYGGTTFSQILQDAFDAAKAAGVVSVASAGNRGCCNTVGYPGKFASVVSVAATDINDNRAAFSSTGPEVDVAAPGVSVLSAKLGGGYNLLSGTSMASPHVAGTAALMLAAGTSPDDVQSILELTAVDLGDPGRDDLYGFGRVNALLAATPGQRVSILDPKDGSRFGENHTIIFSGVAFDGPTDVSEQIEWSSSVDGPFGTGRTVATQLTVGDHVIDAAALGLVDSINVSVLVDTNPEPRVAIVSPEPNHRFIEGEPARFIGQADDDLDGNLDAEIRWTSDKLGFLGQAREVTTQKLPLGENLITADVTDSDGNMSTDSIVVFVDPPKPPEPLRVESVLYTRSKLVGPWISLTVEIQLSEQRPNILLTADLRAQGGSYLTIGDKTNGQGLVKIILHRIMPGCYELRVLDVSVPWDGVTPPNNSCQ